MDDSAAETPCYAINITFAVIPSEAKDLLSLDPSLSLRMTQK